MKELEKARNIIRLTMPDFCLLCNCDTVQQYNTAVSGDVGNTPLTKEEFDLLRKISIY